MKVRSCSSVKEQPIAESLFAYRHILHFFFFESHERSSLYGSRELMSSFSSWALQTAQRSQS